MRKNLIPIIILVFILTIRAQITEFPIISEDGDQNNPSIYGDNIVWEDGRKWSITNEGTFQDWDIYYYNVGKDTKYITSDDSIAQILLGWGLQNNPIIYKNIIVYEERLSATSYSAICARDLSTMSVATISEHSRKARLPIIYENIIVWEDTINENADIFGYDIGKDGEFDTTDDKGRFQLRRDNNQTTPVTNGNIIIWTDDRDKNNKGLNIYGLEPGPDDKFGTPDDNEFSVVTKAGDQFNPAIYEDIIVWIDNRNDNYDIYGCYLPSCESTEFQVTAEKSKRGEPDVYGNIIVLTEYRNGTSDILGDYAGSDGKFGTPDDVKFSITNDDHPKSNPDIFQNIVVWTENKYGNNDIYCAILDFEKLFPTPAPSAIPQTVQPIITLPPTTTTITLPPSTVPPKTEFEKLVSWLERNPLIRLIIILAAIITVVIFFLEDIKRLFSSKKS